jgi:hypothetical protein
VALYAGKLSVWEIAHRWYGEDPDKTRTAAELLLDVKDMLRNLCGAVWREELISMLLRSNESDYGARPKTRVSEFDDELTACCHDGVIDVEFLRFLKVDRAYLNIWCKEKDVAFPEFWKCPYLYEIGNGTGNGGAVGAEPEAPQAVREGGGCGGRLDANTTDVGNGKSGQHQKAALVRYEGLSELKRRFIRFRLAGKAPSDQEGARRFFRTLSPEEQNILGRDPVRTLTEAMTAFSKRKPEQWLIGFDPAAPSE